MENKNLILSLFGLASGIVAYRVYEVSGFASAAVSLLIAAWILVNLITKENILSGLGTLLKPFQTSVNFLLLGFLYASFEGRDFWMSLGTGVVASILGAFISMWLFKYWMIGD